MAKKRKEYLIKVPMVPAPPADAGPQRRAEYLSGTMGSHVEIQMDAEECEIMHRLWEALRQAGEMIPGTGRGIKSRADVLRWFFGQLMDAKPYIEVNRPQAKKEGIRPFRAAPATQVGAQN